METLQFSVVAQVMITARRLLTPQKNEIWKLALLISLQVLQSKRTYSMYTFQQSSSWLFGLSKFWASELNVYILDCLMGYNISQFDT